jgi:hypothetical protein
MTNHEPVRGRARRTAFPEPGAARGRRARRTGGAALAAAAAAALLAAPSAAADAPRAAVTPAESAALAAAGVPASALRGLHGPIVTHPVEQPFDYPAGEVCAFPSHSTFPVDDLTQKTWVDDAGNPVFAVESGPLVMRTTNLATGRTVERDVSGTGVLTYPAPDAFVLSGNDWVAGFHTGDRPVHNRWIVAYGYMSVKITSTPSGTSRTLLALRGPHEDLCATLA